MTLSAFATLFALLVFIGGLFYFGRKPDRTTRLLGTAASAVAGGVIGWIAWYLSTVPAGA